VGRPSKLSDDDRREALQLHAAGQSCRAIARRFDVSPTVISRLTRRAAAASEPTQSEPDDTGAAPDDTGAEVVALQPTRIQPETEFPDYVPGFAPDEAVVADTVIEESAQERYRARQEAKREQKAREDAENERKRLDRIAVKERELRDALDAAPKNSPEFWKARTALVKFKKAQRTHFGPMPSKTGVRIHTQDLRDGPPPALWDNPHALPSGGRGFSLVGDR
jgi:hypothetical protein